MVHWSHEEIKVNIRVCLHVYFMYKRLFAFLHQHYNPLLHPYSMASLLLLLSLTTLLFVPYFFPAVTKYMFYFYLFTKEIILCFLFTPFFASIQSSRGGYTAENWGVNVPASENITE